MMVNHFDNPYIESSAPGMSKYLAYPPGSFSLSIVLLADDAAPESTYTSCVRSTETTYVRAMITAVRMAGTALMPDIARYSPHID